ncbi:MAG: hypothetical protein EZS28_039224 [Streblomastix strix]|uniref:Uncharacterized protein n=1 Tax=Streblomastix strix TaxID=222440 RepID=A0A5J4U5I0_9EUKA|nr:MAG: hypothetical protein EZS28_039224 [Streblomastix strix]
MIVPPPVKRQSCNEIDFPQSALIKPQSYSPISIFYIVMSLVDDYSTIIMNYALPPIAQGLEIFILFPKVVLQPCQ